MSLPRFTQSAFFLFLVLLSFTNGNYVIEYTCESRPTLHFEKNVMPADGWLVKCPPCDPSSCYVLGGKNSNNQLVYSEYTQICCSSQHAGITGEKEGGFVIVVKIHHDTNIRTQAITLNNITSKGVYHEDYHYELLPVSSITTLTSKLTTSKSSATITSIPSTTSEPSTTTTSIRSLTSKPSTTSRRLINTTSIRTIVSRSHPLFRATNKRPPNKSSVKPPMIPAFNETMVDELTTDKLIGDMDLLYGVLIGVGSCCILSVLLVFVKTLKNRKNKSLDSYRRYRQSIDTRPCVCYVASNSDAQGLMHDPETCERDCSNKQKQSDAGLNLSKEDCSGDCNDCSVQSCHQKYSF